MKSNQKEQHWLNVIEQQKQSGLTIARYCKTNQINVSSFYGWKKRLTQTSNGAESSQQHHLVPLFVSDSTTPSPSTLTLTIPNGFELAFNEQLAPERLAAFIKAMT